MELELILLAILSLLSHANGAEYELVVVDEDIFSSCPDARPGTLDIHGLLDMSEFSTSMDSDGVTVSGNTTMVWDIQLEDRVTVTYPLASTIRALITRIFCSFLLTFFIWIEAPGSRQSSHCLVRISVRTCTKRIRYGIKSGPNIFPTISRINVLIVRG